MALTRKEESIVLGMVKRGDKNQDIAALFGINQGRISEIKDRELSSGIAAAPAAELPPKGPPGPKGYRLRGKVREALEALDDDDINAAREVLRAGSARYDRNEA